MSLTQATAEASGFSLTLWLLPATRPTFLENLTVMALLSVDARTSSRSIHATAAAERLEILSSRNGAFKCRTVFNCTDACPRGINVTKAIQEVKRAALYEHI